MTKNPSPKFQLEGSLGLRDAEDVKQRLGERLEAGTPIHVDCSGLTEVDASIIQLLISAQKSAAARGIDYSVSVPPDSALAQAMTRGGFLSSGGSDRGPMMPFGVTV